ncbi:hypothetical protein Tco_0891398 [Tanacetum coccineum]|uniref:Uncharacterized protein n=1 Tax=Tanacetum coccineum TaxID=301880 RepID=A0ABQ5C366_9ASTR
MAATLLGLKDFFDDLRVIAAKLIRMELKLMLLGINLLVLGKANAARDKLTAAGETKEKRNMPPTRAQQRSIMCTYLINMAGWKPKDLKNKSFANIPELFDKALKRVNTFVNFRTKLVEGTKMEESSKTAEVMKESSSKRAGDELEQENAKEQKVDDDQEAAKMKELMKIVPDEEEVAVDAISLATKPPSIELGKAKHEYTRLEKGYERVLWEVTITELRRKLELAQKQKDEIELTIEKLENSSKSLSKLIDCQIVDKCKIGLGYNDVPPPYTGNFMPPKHDLSFSGLEEFVNEPIVSEPTVKKPVVETSELRLV